jgi:hypothetical protein
VGGLAYDFFHRQRAPWNIVGVLQDSRVAGGECRRRETKELPERIIPRHDREYHAQGIEHDGTLRRIRLDELRGEKSWGRLGIELAVPGALVNFALRLRDRLPHLPRNQLRIGAATGAKHLGHAA